MTSIFAPLRFFGWQLSPMLEAGQDGTWKAAWAHSEFMAFLSLQRRQKRIWQGKFEFISIYWSANVIIFSKSLPHC